MERKAYNEGFRELLDWGTRTYTHAGTKTHVLETLLDLTLHVSSSGCSYVSFDILRNKQIT